MFVDGHKTCIIQRVFQNLHSLLIPIETIKDTESTITLAFHPYQSLLLVNPEHGSQWLCRADWPVCPYFSGSAHHVFLFLLGCLEQSEAGGHPAAVLCILVLCPYSFFSPHFIRFQVVHQYTTTDMVTACKDSHFIFSERWDLVNTYGELQNNCFLYSSFKHV